MIFKNIYRVLSGVRTGLSSSACRVCEGVKGF